jgi:hypothetical protein
METGDSGRLGLTRLECPHAVPAIASRPRASTYPPTNDNQQAGGTGGRGSGATGQLEGAGQRSADMYQCRVRSARSLRVSFSPPSQAARQTTSSAMYPWGGASFVPDA